jgi:protein-tyrosine-phosphatase
MAEAFLNRLAAGKATAISAGTEPADKVITMGCGVEDMCPAIFVETEDWNIDDPKGKPVEKVREIREQIQVKVLSLLKELS